MLIQFTDGELSYIAWAIENMCGIPGEDEREFMECILDKIEAVRKGESAD